MADTYIEPVAVHSERLKVIDNLDGTFSLAVVVESGGASGGAVTVADGADVAEGATTNAAVITDTTGTVSGKLRGLVKWAFERMPASLGQKTKANSLAVTLASDQDALAVSGTVTADTELPAAAALSDTLANPTTPQIGAAGLLWTGAVWLRRAASSIVTGAALVDLATRLDSTNDSVTSKAGTTVIDLSFTSPNTAGTTTAGTPITGLGPYRTMTLYAALVGATGGTLDIYLQTSPDGGTTWVDWAHFTQKAAGGAATKQVFQYAKAAQQLTGVTVGVGTTPALASGTHIGGDWGDRIRILNVTGAGTSAGAAQSLLAVLSS